MNFVELCLNYKAAVALLAEFICGIVYDGLVQDSIKVPWFFVKLH